jgi:N-alpha-acetyltransferase 50
VRYARLLNRPSRELTDSFFVSFRSVQLKKIHAVSFPVMYHEGFYQDLVKTSDSHLYKFAYFQGVLVGAICSRIEANDSKNQRLYIMTLAVLAGYRGRSVGTQLLRSVLNYCESMYQIREVRLHVQVSNVDAIRFYTDRFGFTQGDLVENYYKRINPPHCFLLFKMLQPA